MYLKLNANTAYKPATLAWELNRKANSISLNVDLKGSIGRMVRNRAIDVRIRRVQVMKSVAVWNTVNGANSELSIQRVSAERNAIARMERMKH
ncbi:MAG: hypothetical protein WCG87_07060 [Bacteroidota bacterium]